MKQFLITNEGATEREISEFENKWQIQLPKQFRDFCERTDGATIDDRWNFVLKDPLSKEKKAYQITRLFPLSIVNNGIERILELKVEKVESNLVVGQQMTHQEYISILTSQMKRKVIYNVREAVHEIVYGISGEKKFSLFKNYWPIGEVNIGLVMIGLSGDDCGRVVIITFGDKKFFKKIHLADSFDEFLQQFKKVKKQLQPQELTQA